MGVINLYDVYFDTMNENLTMNKLINTLCLVGLNYAMPKHEPETVYNTWLKLWVLLKNLWNNAYLTNYSILARI